MPAAPRCAAAVTAIALLAAEAASRMPFAMYETDERRRLASYEERCESEVPPRRSRCRSLRGTGAATLLPSSPPLLGLGLLPLSVPLRSAGRRRRRGGLSHATST